MSVEGNSDSTTAQFWFSSDDKFRFGIETADIFVTNAVFRDCSAWYHFLLAFDAANATSADKIILYVNGVRQTTSTYTAPSNTDYGFNRSGAIHSLCRRQNNADWYFNGYVAQAQFIDGQALTPASFAETDATTGQWIPKAFSGGSYGTNGFYLKFADNSTTAALGTDSSGNGNTWTTNNFSVTAGAGNDSMVDTPTSYGTDTGVGGEVRGNYATLNALALNGNTLSNGNLDYLAGGNNKPTLTTIGIPASGKWYIEITDVNSGNGSFIGGVGTASANVGTYLGADANGWSYQTHASNAGYFNNNTFTTTGRINGHGSNTILGIAIDRDAQKIWFAINGTFVNSGAPASGTNAQYSNLPTSGELFAGGSTGTGQNITFNGGQRAFAYTAPSGFKCLVDTNLPVVAAKPNTLMDVVLYTGDGGTQTVSGLAFGPDFVWTKVRNIGYGHRVWDTVRGATKRLETHDTTAEVTETTALTAFNSDGFTVGSEANVNQSGRPYVAWCWDAGTSTVANNSGSISSQVRANASAGFSVVTYQANAPNNTIGHGLGVRPEFVITKARTRNDNWLVYHSALGVDKWLHFNRELAVITTSGIWGASGDWTSTKFGVSTNSIEGNNYGSNDFVAYCFAPVVGYSSFGSYVGNGSSDGVFVHLGFRPKWLMVKRTDAAEYWIVFDSVRNTYNIVDLRLLPSSSSAESSLSTNPVDFLSNGFKNRGSDTFLNASGGTYVYAAFAESPFQYARAR
jgi:hypothetical protein